ncbi:MAG: hypothetical protein LBU44_05825 [Mediterranea sp.]|jgi:hypothetical protein|nr:hypothetical protein [Mediterranea sp.]
MDVKTQPKAKINSFDGNKSHSSNFLSNELNLQDRLNKNGSEQLDLGLGLLSEQKHDSYESSSRSPAKSPAESPAY